MENKEICFCEEGKTICEVRFCKTCLEAFSKFLGELQREEAYKNLVSLVNEDLEKKRKG